MLNSLIFIYMFPQDPLGLHLSFLIQDSHQTQRCQTDLLDFEENVAIRQKYLLYLSMMKISKSKSMA